MIEINLIPSSLRKKKKVNALVSGLNMPLEIVVGSIGGVFLVLFVLHAFLLLINVGKIVQRNNLKGQWQSILPAKESVDGVIAEMRALQTSHKAIEDVTTGKRIIWSQKLNIISDSLPRGVWLKKIALTDEMFFVDGSAISSENKEMVNIHSLTSALKENKDFMEQLSELELGSIQRRKIQKMEIADFLITTKIQ